VKIERFSLLYCVAVLIMFHEGLVGYSLIRTLNGQYLSESRCLQIITDH
jgi:hypothetical protein